MKVAGVVPALPSATVTSLIDSVGVRSSSVMVPMPLAVGDAWRWPASLRSTENVSFGLVERVAD